MKTKCNIGNSHSEVFNKIGFMTLNHKINASKVPVNHMIFYGRIGVNLQLYYSRTLLQEVFKHFKHVSNILRNVNAITAELRQTKKRPVSF